MTPATTLPSAVAGLAEQLVHGHANGVQQRIVGSGTWLDAGRPVLAESNVNTRDTAGIIEYVPGDLVITVGAGTTLQEIADVTSEHAQWLALDPFGSNDGTIGATVATASSGPLATGAGRIRDLVLGITSLASNGDAIRAGGRVVKNVAGFDLVRLATGAWGTLGVITEVSLRLHARPAIDETIAIALDPAIDIGTHVARIGAINPSALGVLALEIVSAAAITSALLEGSMASRLLLLVRLSGNRDRVHAQRSALSQLGHTTDLPTDVWGALRGMDGVSSAVARISDAPVLLGATISTVTAAIASAQAPSALLCASPLTGRVRVALPYSGDDDEHVRAFVKDSCGLGSSVVWERMPSDVWAYVDAAATDQISLRIRDAYDPHHALNRGIFGAIGGH